MVDWKLSKKEYDKLLEFLGYGDLPSADIIVFGNEEGTGGYSLHANIKARVHNYGHDEHREPIHTIFNGGSYVGYYEPSSGRKIIEQYDPSKASRLENKSNFNEAVARISLSIESIEGLDWFDTKNIVVESRVKEYLKTELYAKRKGIQTALIDWRPLPRGTESVWYKEEYGDIGESKANNYLRCFNNPTNYRNNKLLTDNEFSDYYMDMIERSKRLKAVFENSNAKIILGIGGANGFKKKALELMFGKGIFKELIFNDVEMYNGKGQKLKSFFANISTQEGKDLYIFLIPFPNVGRTFKTKEDSMRMLRELTFTYIKPIIENRKMN